MDRRQSFRALAIVGSMLLVACSGAPSVASPTAGSSTAPTPVVTAAATPSIAVIPTLISTVTSSQPATGGTPVGGAATSGTGTEQVNMDELFPPGPGRDLVLNNCTNCHSIVPIVLARLDHGGWQQNRANMAPKVPNLTPAQIDKIYAYLEENFYPGKPVPKLPQDLLNTWTSY